MSTSSQRSKSVSPSEGRIDVARVRAATEEDIERWQREDDHDDEALGPPHFVIPVPNVRAIRERLALSQEGFARRFGLSLRTVQEWEQGRRAPDGPARVLLHVIDQQPEAVERAVAGQSGSR